MKSWTKKELEAQYEDKRKLKSVSNRKPKNGLSFAQLKTTLAEKTEFRKCDIREIINALNDLIVETLNKKQFVRLGDICTIYPSLRRTRQGTCLKGGHSKKQMIVPPRWETRIKPHKNLQIKLKELEVTEEDIENLYL